MVPLDSHEQDPFSKAENNELPSSFRMSEIISALSYALDLTEGQPMGHSVRACMIGMRIAQQIGMSAEDQADLYYALLLKDAGCSSNASRLFHILNADEIRAKGDVKTTDWTRVGWESLHYALTHVATGMPFLQRMQRLFQVAATQQQDSCTLVKIRCERGAYIAKQLGFSESFPRRNLQSGRALEWPRISRRAPQERNSHVLQNRKSLADAGCLPHRPRAGRRHRSRAETQRPLV